MSLYVLIDLALAAAPLLLSFDRRVGFARRWGAVFLSILVVAPAYLGWDSFMAAHGAWGFSTRFAGSTRIFHLPPGELLFFIVVPFSCLFIYEVVLSTKGEKEYRVGRLPWFAAGVALLGAGAALIHVRLYTSTVLVAAGLFLLASSVFSPRLLRSRVFWLSVAISYVPFLLANGILTALPVVTYGASAILGPRIHWIPIEDFLYSFTLLGFTFLFYRTFRDRFSLITSVAEPRAGLSISRPLHDTRRATNFKNSDRTKTPMEKSG